MFHKWGFLLTEIWVLLAGAALIGVLAGWIIWGRRPTATTTDTSETDRLRADLAACTARTNALSAKLAAAESDLAAAKAVAVVRAAISSATAPAPMAALAPPRVAAPVREPTTAIPAATAGASKPQGLTSARGGVPDDLKLVKGIGPKLEQLCHSLGFYHFDQIANWTAAEIAWVDENLEGFRGRVTRDNWVAQARDLAAAKPPLTGNKG